MSRPNARAILLRLVKSADKVVFTRDCGISLKQFYASDFQHTKKTWEVMGITKGCLPNIVYDCLR